MGSRKDMSLAGVIMQARAKKRAHDCEELAQQMDGEAIGISRAAWIGNARGTLWLRVLEYYSY